MGKRGGFIAQVLGTIITIIGVLTSAYGGGWLIAVGMAMTAAGGYASARAAAKELRTDNDFKGSGHLLNTRAIDAPIPIVYGQMRVGGNQVFLNTTGPDNKYLHVIQTLAEGEIEEITTVYLNDKETSDPFFTGIEVVAKYTGTHSQVVNTDLVAKYDLWNDALHGTAYIYLQIIFNRDKFQGIPLITALVKGKKLYDTRDGSTAYSNNPALVIYDLLNNSDYGMGIDTSLLDAQSFNDSANWCDANSYTFNGVLKNQENALDIIEKCLLNFRGTIVYTDGLYKLRIFKFDAPVMTIDDNDVVDGTFMYSLLGFSDMPNKFKVSYIDTDENYITSEFDFADELIVTADGMERIQELNLIGTAVYQQAVDLATFNYERQRLSIHYSCTLGSIGLALEPADIILVNHKLPGWTDEGNPVPCRIIDVVYGNDFTASITFVEEQEILYDSKLNALSHTAYAGNFFDPTTIPVGASAITLTEEHTFQTVSAGESRLTHTRLKVTFNAPATQWWDYSEVWVAIIAVGAADPVDSDYEHIMNVTNTYFIEPVEENKEYFVKMISVSIHGVKQAIADVGSSSKQIAGSTLSPGNVTNFRATTAADIINFNWDAVTDIDLVGYEIRRGSDWNTSVIVAFIKSVTFMAVGVVPDDHTFLIKAKDSRGTYSDTAASLTITVNFPIAHSTHFSNASTVGTHSFTTWKEASSLPGMGDALAGVGQVLCYDTDAGASDTASFVTGALHLTTAIGSGYEETTVFKERWWLEYDFVVTGDETLWHGKFNSTALWSKYSTLFTWAGIFQSSASGSLTAQFHASMDDITYSTIDNFHIYAPETSAVYVKYKINFADLSTEARVLVKPTTLIGAYWSTIP